MLKFNENVGIKKYFGGAFYVALIVLILLLIFSADWVTVALFIYIIFYTINVWLKAYAEMKHAKKYPYRHYRKKNINYK